MASQLKAREGVDEESRRTLLMLFVACTLPFAYISGAPGDGATSDLGRAALVAAFILTVLSSMTRGATRTSLFKACLVVKTFFLSVCCHHCGFGSPAFLLLLAQDSAATAIAVTVMVGRQDVVPLTVLSASGPLSIFVIKSCEFDVFGLALPRQLSELSMAEKQEWLEHLLAVMLTAMAGVLLIAYFKLEEMTSCVEVAAKFLCCCQRRASRASDVPPAGPEGGPPAAMAEPLPSVTAPTTTYGRAHADAGNGLAEQPEVSHDRDDGRSTPAATPATGNIRPGPGDAPAEAPDDISSLGLSESSFLTKGGGP